MGSPLESALVEIIMVALKESTVRMLKDHCVFGKRYIDNTLTFVKDESINYVP